MINDPTVNYVKTCPVYCDSDKFIGYFWGKKDSVNYTHFNNIH